MGQTQSSNKVKEYKNGLINHLKKGKNNLKLEYNQYSNGNLINKIKNKNINISETLSEKINSVISELHDQVLGANTVIPYNESKSIKIKELIINILYLHEIRIIFYELLNTEIVNVLIKKGLLRGGLQNNNVRKINLKARNEVIYLKDNKDSSVKKLFSDIKNIVQKNLKEYKFLLVKNNLKNNITIYDYLVLEMHKEDNEILKKPTVLDTISILKDLSQKLNKKKEYKELLESGDIKQALDNYYENVLKLDKEIRINNLVNAGNQIIKNLQENLKNIKLNSPRNVSHVHTTGGVNKSKINKQDSIKKMKLKQQKEMNKLKLKQKNELLKLKNKQKKELKSKSKKSTNKCCNCKKNFSSKASLTNHKKKCN